MTGFSCHIGENLNECARMNEWPTCSDSHRHGRISALQSGLVSLCWFILLVILHLMPCDDDIYGQSVNLGAKIAAEQFLCDTTWHSVLLYYCYHMCDHCLGSHTSEKRNYCNYVVERANAGERTYGKMQFDALRSNWTGIPLLLANVRERDIFNANGRYKSFLLIAGCSWLPHSNPYGLVVNFNWRTDQFSFRLSYRLLSFQAAKCISFRRRKYKYRSWWSAVLK